MKKTLFFSDKIKEKRDKLLFMITSFFMIFFIHLLLIVPNTTYAYLAESAVGETIDQQVLLDQNDDGFAEEEVNAEEDDQTASHGTFEANEEELAPIFVAGNEEIQMLIDILDDLERTLLEIQAQIERLYPEVRHEAVVPDVPSLGQLEEMVTRENSVDDLIVEEEEVVVDEENDEETQEERAVSEVTQAAATFLGLSPEATSTLRNIILFLIIVLILYLLWSIWQSKRKI